MGIAPVVKKSGAEPVPSLNTCRISYVVLGNIPAMKTLVLFPGTPVRTSVFRQAGWSLTIANWTKTDSAEDGGTL
jgi:hypothetical protein